MGLNTNIDFLLSLSSHAEFEAGNVHTSFIQQHYDQLFPKPTAPGGHVVCQAALGLLLQEREHTLEFLCQSHGQNTHTHTPKVLLLRAVFSQLTHLLDLG